MRFFSVVYLYFFLIFEQLLKSANLQQEAKIDALGHVLKKRKKKKRVLSKMFALNSPEAKLICAKKVNCNFSLLPNN